MFPILKTLVRCSSRAAVTGMQLRNAQWSAKKYQRKSVREASMLDWGKTDVSDWLFDVCRAPGGVLQQVAAAFPTGRALAQMEYAELEHLKLGFYFTNLIFNEACLRRDSPELHVDSDPYQYPYNGIIHPGNTALVVVDMQNDFLDQEGYIAQVNKKFDIQKAREIIPPLQQVLHKMRALGFHIIHTREGHHGSLMDLPANKHWRSRMGRGDPGIGDPAPYKGGMSRILTRDHAGWEIIPELTPLPNEIVIDKPGKGVFCGTSFEMHLQLSKIQNLIMTGVTTDVCVHTIISEANDRGYA